MTEQLGFDADNLTQKEADFVDFCTQLLQLDPTNRPTALQALDHPFIVNTLRACVELPDDENGIFYDHPMGGEREHDDDGLDDEDGDYGGYAGGGGGAGELSSI